MRTILRDPRRLTARMLLAALMGLFVFAIASAPTGGLMDSSVIAQTSSPSPQKLIEIINPHSGTSTEISAKSDGTDTAYHLVAWVKEMPANPSVEFKYQSASVNREVSIGLASQVGPDAWELDWPSGLIPAEGTYTLRAILFSGTSEVSRDEMSVVVNNADPDVEASPTATNPPEPQGETVEMTYPTNGGGFGFYTPLTGSDKAPRGVIDVMFSNGTEKITAYYTVSPPGSEPTFKKCGEETAAQAADGILCKLIDNDNALAVRAVATLARDAKPAFPSNTADDPDSADAHRVTPYSAVPKSVELNPQTQRQNAIAADGGGSTFPCSQAVVVTIRDQFARKMQGVNLDVHASGPTDNLSFDDDGGASSSANQPPDSGGHSTEAAVDCESAANPKPFSGSQGEHERPLGTPDIKHIETKAAGTNDAGQWNFVLQSRDAGETQFSVWADTDDNDLKCEEEARGDGSIGWNQEPPTPTGFPDDQTTCPAPQPSPSGSPSPTASPTGSPTASPTASPTGSPTGSPSPSPTTQPKCPGFENDSRNQVVGTEGDDQLTGTEGDDIICGLGGDDDIDGLGGDDLIFGGDGNDSIVGGDGHDEIEGGDGKDGIRGNDGDDFIDGGKGNDVILGNKGSDVIFGSNGEDILRGGADSDFVKGGGGTDTVQGGSGPDTVVGNADKDTLKGGTGADLIKGGSEDDTLRGGKGNDALKGGKGDDVLKGGKGTDQCNGGGGNDTVVGCEN